MLNSDAAEKPPHMSVLVAYGPSTTSANLKYEPLEEFIQVISRSSPDLFVLNGPFLDAEHEQITENSDAAYSDIFETRVLSCLKSLLSEMSSSGKSEPDIAVIHRLGMCITILCGHKRRLVGLQGLRRMAELNSEQIHAFLNWPLGMEDKRLPLGKHHFEASKVRLSVECAETQRVSSPCQFTSPVELSRPSPATQLLQSCAIACRWLSVPVEYLWLHKHPATRVKAPLSRLRLNNCNSTFLDKPFYPYSTSTLSSASTVLDITPCWSKKNSGLG